MGLVNGAISTAAPPPTVGCPSEGTAATAAIASQAADARLQLTTIYRQRLDREASILAQGKLGGLVLPPGIYQAAGGSFLLTGSDLTWMPKGTPTPFGFSKARVR